MDIGNTLSESLEYAKEAVWGKWVRWLLLLVCVIIFPLIYGYQLEVYRGKKPAPELTGWGKLFIDGIKYLVITIVYMIPVILAAIIFFIPVVAVFRNPSPQAIMAAWATVAGGIVFLIILACILALFAYIGVIRFARTGSMGEAFNFGAIVSQIGRIGWLSYIFSLIVLIVVVMIIVGIISLIPYLGPFLAFIVSPAIMLFTARFLTLLYDSAGPASAPAP